MNHGHRRGCGCHNERQSRWVEPTILYLLWEKQMHGYELMSELPKLRNKTIASTGTALFRNHLSEMRRENDEGKIAAK